MGDISPQYQVAAKIDIPDELSLTVFRAAHDAMLDLVAFGENPGKIGGYPHPSPEDV